MEFSDSPLCQKLAFAARFRRSVIFAPARLAGVGPRIGYEPVAVGSIRGEPRFQALMRKLGMPQ